MEHAGSSPAARTGETMNRLLRRLGFFVSVQYLVVSKRRARLHPLRYLAEFSMRNEIGARLFRVYTLWRVPHKKIYKWQIPLTPRKSSVTISK